MTSSSTPTRSQLLMAAVGEQILTYRETAGLTVEQLGETVGMTADELDRLEHGWADISLSTLQAVADALGVTVAELIDVSGSELGLSL